MGENYKNMMSHLLSLPVVTMITTGRTGTDFVQSLLDGHPQVVVFNGHVQFGDYWAKARTTRMLPLNADDILDEFIGHYIHRFKSRYDHIERKDRLGPQYGDSLNLDTAVLKGHARSLLSQVPITRKTVLVAIYGAYALTLGQDVMLKKLFFHHEHNVEGIGPFLEDFPLARIICMTRDPRANFYSGVLHHRQYDSNKDNGRHVVSYIRRILVDAGVLRPLGRDYIAIRLEDMGHPGMMARLCEWLGIDEHPCLKESTWGGLLWHGDRLSKEKKGDKGFSAKLLENGWQSKMPWTDQMVLNGIMYNRLRAYGYSSTPLTWWSKIMVVFLILWPLAFEWHFLSPGYLYKHLAKGDIKRILSNGWCYCQRVVLFYQYAFRVFSGEAWEEPLLRP